MKIGEPITKITEQTFRGHIVRIVDLDSRDEFHIELMMNDALEGGRLEQACFREASKHEIVSMTGNSFDYEYIGLSGKVVIQRKEVTHTLLEETTKENQILLNSYNHG